MKTTLIQGACTMRIGPLRRVAVGVIFLVHVAGCESNSEADARPMSIQDLESCPGDRCGITLTHSVSVVPPTDTLSFKIATMLALNSKGEFLAAPSWTPDGFSVYSRDGQFVRFVGKKGRGPGEFESVMFLFVGPGDTVYVENRTQTDVLTPSYVYSRRGYPVSYVDAAVASDNTIFVNPRIGYHEDRTVKILDPATMTLQPFSDEKPNKGFEKQCRVVAVGPNDTVWTIGCFSHIVYEFDREGGLVQAYTRPATWFVGTEEDGKFVPWRVRDSHIDQNGVLWTVIYHHVVISEDGGEAATMKEEAEQHRTYIEAIDLRTMKVLGRTWVQGSRLKGFLPDGRVYGFTDDPAGYSRADVWTVSISAHGQAP